jgi:hypothetical protein
VAGGGHRLYGQQRLSRPSWARCCARMCYVAAKVYP